MIKKVFLTILALSLLLTSPTFALSESLLDFFDSIKAFYFDPEGENCIPSGHQISSNGDNLTIIGDSLTLGARKEIFEQFPKLTNFNAIVGRTWQQGIEALKNTNLLPIVIFALGANSPNTDISEVNSVIDLIGPNHTIVFITNHTKHNSYEKLNNTLIDISKKHQNILIADWANAIKDKEDQFLTNDGTHQNSAGLNLFATTLHQTLNQATIIAPPSNVFSQKEMKLIEENKPFYQTAATKYNFPWQILAVLHRREHGLLRDNPSNGQGAYQLYSYTNGGTNERAFLPAGKITDSEFTRQTDIAAQLISENYAKGLNLFLDNDVKTFFFRYNGQAEAYINQARDLGFSLEEAKRGEGSPYVMNRADSRRDSSSNPNWRQISTDGGKLKDPANKEYGTFIMFQALGGSSGFSHCGSSGHGDINRTAIELAYPTTGNDYNNPKPSYRSALQSTKVNLLGDFFSKIGASCDAFVATVMRHSGADPDFVCCGVSYHGKTWQYVTSSGKYREIPNTPESLRPGDIRLSDGHIELYVEVNGVGKIASASHHTRTGEILDFYPGRNFKAYRLIK